MKSRYFGWFLLASLASLPVIPGHAAENQTVQERGDPAERQKVIAAVDAWRAAVVKGDRTALEHIYHPELAYGHAYGAVLNRDEQIDTTLRPGRVFPAVDAQNVAVRIYGNVAFVTGTWTFHLRDDDGSERQSRLSGLDVWTKDRGHWQMIARQLTRPTDGPAR